MTQPRNKLVDSSVTLFYHCRSRCARGMHLCGRGREHRKQWIEERLRELVRIFAIEVCGYAVLSNHMHLLVRLDGDVADGWADEELVRRWARLHPPRDRKGKVAEVTDEWVAGQVKDKEWVSEIRKRLKSLGWFMKSLKEPLARMANREDNVPGPFWGRRYDSLGILDEGALLSILSYVDLNVMAAGLAETPEDSPHTSVKARVDHCREIGALDHAVPRSRDSGLGDQAFEYGQLKDDEKHWLVPIEDRRERVAQHAASSRGAGGVPCRAGMTANMTLASYLQLLDWASRLKRAGKRRVPPEVAPILERIGCTPEVWTRQFCALRSRNRLHGTVVATCGSAVKAVAERRGLSRVVNALPRAE